MTEPDDAEVIPDLPAETGEAHGVDENQEFLLNRLLYRGVLPRYAFPTDVATFYVFDQNRSTDYRYAYQFAPSQALSVALSQYAPGKEVWIANKLFRSGAVFSPMASDRASAWREKRFYYECSNCRFACTKERRDGTRGERIGLPGVRQGRYARSGTPVPAPGVRASSARAGERVHRRTAGTQLCDSREA